MTTDLGRRLHDLAVDAPPSLPTEGLWDRGVRRHRTRRAAGVVAVVAAVIGGFSLQTANHLRGDSPPPAGTPAGIGHLPRTIHVPAAWSKGTRDAGELGVLSAVGSSDRKRPKGIAGMVAYSSLYGISAVDSTVRFLDLPTSSSRDMPGQVVDVALSPDGRKVAYPRFDWTTGDGAQQETQIGWAIYDTVTGRSLELADPAFPRIVFENLRPVFSGDSRYLLTAYRPQSSDDTQRDLFVAWDVATGTRHLVEDSDLDPPNPGSGPKGIVWSRGDTTYTFNPTSGKRTSIQSDHDPVAASFAPNGTAFAYLGGTRTVEDIKGPFQLYVGASTDRLRRVPGVADWSRILGWRDPEHVVVGITDRDYAIVDVSDGSMQRDSFEGAVDLSLPMQAADLWANDLVDGVQPPTASDPRTPGRWAVLGGVLVAGAAFALYRRRRRHG